MSLHGTLETFALPDVMALLAATKKSGELRVVGGKIDGRVHLAEGRVVAAEVGRADSFVDAVFELLRLTSGKFSFDADKAPSDPSDPVEVEPLLFEAQGRLTEWRGIEAVIPSMDHGVVLVSDLTDPHVTLASDQWRMLVTVAGVRCVSEVADRLGLGEYAVCKSLRELVESGVAAVTDPPAPAPKPAPKPAAKAAEPAPATAPEPAPQAAAEPEPAPDSTPEPKPEPQAQAKADPEPAPAAKPAPAPEAEAKAATPVIEPELKPTPLDTPVAVQALTTTDPGSPAPPGQEPPAPSPKAKKPEPPKAETPPKPETAKEAKDKVDAAQAKQLVSQLAALSADKPADKKAEPKAKADDEAAKAPKAKADDDAAKPAEDAPAGEGGDAEEPLNRGLLLKFLSSVRQ